MDVGKRTGLTVKDVYEVFESFRNRSPLSKEIRCSRCGGAVGIIGPSDTEFSFGCNSDECGNFSFGWPVSGPTSSEQWVAMYSIVHENFYVLTGVLPRLVYRIAGKTKYVASAEPGDPDYETAERFKF